MDTLLFFALIYSIIGFRLRPPPPSPPLNPTNAPAAEYIPRFTPKKDITREEDTFTRPVLAVTQPANGSAVPSATSSSTVSLKTFPRRTTLTECHSLSLSFCPANRTSGPLPEEEGPLERSGHHIADLTMQHATGSPEEWRQTASSHAAPPEAGGPAPGSELYDPISSQNLKSNLEFVKTPQRSSRNVKHGRQAVRVSPVEALGAVASGCLPAGRRLGPLKG
ncbi:hypothetical protein EYF80_057744 [Liparis tanakae]|uniref:Uncharacterized protein n=1 Tax=Liparis tanakae TaxID=230148 RepID=A0A4Z2ETB7_9TELE|nr:hypothetical protein EYF80_057744 [Liparis tanakae]